MNRGVVLVRTEDRDLQLQALRTTLSLSLGDRAADLLISGRGVAVLDPAPNTEAQHCLQALRRMTLGIQLDEAVSPSRLHPVAEVLRHADFVERLATAAFVQVF